MPKIFSDSPLSVSISFVEGETFKPGQSFHTIVEIRNRASQGRVDLIVSYDVLDPDGKTVISNSKTVAVETKASFAEEIDLPSHVKQGLYVLKVNVTTLDGSKWTEISRSFKVIEPSLQGELNISVLELIMAIALAGAIIGLIYEHRRVSKLKFSNEDFKKFIRGKGGIV